MSIENFAPDINIEQIIENDEVHQNKINIKVLEIENEKKEIIKLTKVNDILLKFDYSDEEEDQLRDFLMKFNNGTLDFLQTQSVSDVMTFIIDSLEEDNSKLEEDNSKLEEDNSKLEEDNSKLEEEYNKYEKIIKIENEKQKKLMKEIESFIPQSILDNNLDIKEALEQGDVGKILKIFQNPLRLKSIINAIGGADIDNPEYQEFKNNLINIDSNYISLFESLENGFIAKNIDTNKIVDSIEYGSGGKIDIDLKSIPPVSKMSLVNSEYSFDKNLDLKALSELRSDIKDELNNIQNGITTLNIFDNSFNSLLSNVAKIWNNENFNIILSNIILSFSNDIFNELAEIYQNMDIPQELQINEFDINNLSSVNSKEELKQKIEIIKDKIEQSKDYIGNKQEKLLATHSDDIKELLQRESKEKENQIETLKFMKNCGFDKIPKDISNKLIKNIQSNSLLIPGLNLSPQNIDLKNGHFGENSIINKENGLTPNAKANMVKFMNKMISGNTDEPLNITAIINGTTVAQPGDLRDKFNKAGIIGNLGWNYNKIKNNLRKDNKKEEPIN